MQIVELKQIGVPVGYTADTSVSVMIVRTEFNLYQTVQHVTGTLMEVLTLAAEWLPPQEDWEIEEDGVRDMSTPELVLQELTNRKELCAEEDPTVVVIDLGTGQVIYI